MTAFEENYDYDNGYSNEHIDNQYNIHEEEKTAPSEIPHHTKKSIVFVTLAEIKLLIQAKCREISEVFGVSDDEALILLNHFKWRKDALENELLGNGASTYTQAGLEPTQQAELSELPEILCPMCFDTKPKDEFDCLKCNHLICKECWTDFITFQITRPENAFFWACPYEGCNMKVPNGFNLKYAETNIQPQYYKKMAVAYADNSKSLRWCPAAGCEYGAEVPGLEVRAIECPCGWIYCFKCGLEDHRPCDCDIADEWLKKDGESDATNKWLNLYTKNCPKCKKPIEKTYGCNIMRCGNPGCGHTFCWLCLGDYSKHPWCNKYTSISSKEKNKQKLELKKYIFYYERFKNNKMAFDSVDKIIKTVESEKRDLVINLGLALNQVEFLKEACQVLRNCERILKWSYAYGFYLNNDKQRNIYEIIQEKLDVYSSELYVMLERKYEESKRSVSDFMDFKRNVQAAVFKCKQSSETFLAEQEWLQAGGKELGQEKKKKFFKLNFGLFRKLLSK